MGEGANLWSLGVRSGSGDGHQVCLRARVGETQQLYAGETLLQFL